MDKAEKAGQTSDVTFKNLLGNLIGKPESPENVVTLQSSPLAHLDYQEELKIKNRALAQLWKHYRLPGLPEMIIASPKPRGYRTTSKRKTHLRGDTLYLLFNDRALRFQKKPFVESPLEPREHGRIFDFLQKKISEGPFRLVATHLNYLIIRGSYKEQAVIFNVNAINGPLVRKIKILGEHLRKFSEKVSSAYIYTDPSCSDYYLEGKQPSDILKIKKLFGREQLAVSHHNCRYYYHPTSFSQINESMVPIMLEKAKEMLAPQPDEYLLDLYCGYGLFSHFLAPWYRKVMGVDAEGPSIRGALANRKCNPQSKGTRFIARHITEKSIEELPFQEDQGAESILLDPPRQGPQKNVIAALGRRRPNKVLHIHCGIEQIPDSIKEWKQWGYHPARIVALDMFSGSANLEVLILFTGDKIQQM